MTQQLTDVENKILHLINPLKSININPSLHSFYNFKELKTSVESLLTAESNLIFYVLHQNFMCDDAHEEFFKNIIGRFYDLPEKFWDYYRGNYFLESNNKEAIVGLVLMENAFLFKRTMNGDDTLIHHKFSIGNYEKRSTKLFNKHALQEYHGLQELGDIRCTATYTICRLANSIKVNPRYGGHELLKDLGTYQYEFGRFNTNSAYIIIDGSAHLNPWFKADFEYINTLDSLYPNIRNYAVYASLGLENMDQIIQAFKGLAKQIDKEINDSQIPSFNQKEERIIRSLSQTFPWTKEFIYNNLDNLDLNILCSNMSVPWDMELVKFFISKGYANRMSENKAIFDKVFEPILTEEILDKLFRLEYEKF